MLKKALFWSLIAVVFVSIMISNPIPIFAGNAVDIYVDSTSGDDSNDGLSSQTPVKTLKRAFELVVNADEEYSFILSSGSYASPGKVTVPNNVSLSITTAGVDDDVLVFKNPDTPDVENIFEFTSQNFSLISFNNITVSGDNPETEAIENSGIGVLINSCDNSNLIEFDNCKFENLLRGIYEKYSYYLSMTVKDSHFIVPMPVEFEYGKNLTVTNSIFEMDMDEYSPDAIRVSSTFSSEAYYRVTANITNNKFIGTSRNSRGIRGYIYSATIANNEFENLEEAIDLEIYEVDINNNTFETIDTGIYLKPRLANSTVLIKNNTLINKDFKIKKVYSWDTYTKGIELYNSDGDYSFDAFTIENNKIINYFMAMNYENAYTPLNQGLIKDNKFWGNSFNVFWRADDKNIAEPYVDAKNNDWGTNDSTEVYKRIYVYEVEPDDVFILDDTFSTNVVNTAYIDSSYTAGNAGEHDFGINAFATIQDALPYVAPGGTILVKDGDYEAPVWIERPVNIKGVGDNVNLTPHPSQTSYNAPATTVTANNTSFENLNFKEGEAGLLFTSYMYRNYSEDLLVSYPYSYKVLNCRFIDFNTVALYEDEGSYLFNFEALPDSIVEIRGNEIFRTDNVLNSVFGVYINSKAENLIFSDNTISGTYNFGFGLNGKHLHVENNVVSPESNFYNDESVVRINSSGDLMLRDNKIVYQGEIPEHFYLAGLNLYFYRPEGSAKKEIYRNAVEGFYRGLSLFQENRDDVIDITIGGSPSNANSFIGNEIGLWSAIGKEEHEPVDATYNRWGIEDDQLDSYIKFKFNGDNYRPVTYLPSMPTVLASEATLLNLTASNVSLTPSFNSDIYNYTGTVAHNINKTTITATSKHSGATVKINGEELKNKVVSLNVGSNVIVVQVTAQNGTIVKTYTITIERGSATPSSGSSGRSTYEPPSIEVTTDKINNNTVNSVVVDSNTTSGAATVSISSEMLSALLDKAKETSGTGKNDLLQIVIDTPKNINELTLNIPQTEFEKIADRTSARFGVNSPFLSVIFDGKAVKTISEAEGIGVISVNTTKVSDINERSAYDLTVKKGNAHVSDFKGGMATVTIPYELKPGENPNAIVVNSLRDEGILDTVRGYYDVSLKSVVFKAPKFLTFSIGYNQVNFTDVMADAWYKEPVDFLAARDITSGTGDNMFSPNAKLTRAQFVMLIMNSYKIDTQSMAILEQGGNFTDAGNTYYTDYLLAAKALGIVDGIGGNMFAPEKEITRQEMFVMLYNTLNIMDEIPDHIDDILVPSFNDLDEIASWANEATFFLVNTGIIGGYNNNICPVQLTSRAEIAQVIFNLLSK